MAAPDQLVVKFFARVTGESVAALLQVVDRALQEGTKRITLLTSTPGGDVVQGLSAYNYLRGLPLPVDTHNFGSVDSIGIVLFCAGRRRASVPHARFLLHGVAAQFGANTQLEEKQLEERLKALRIDTENIARVISDTSGQPLPDVVAAMLERTTLNPEQAKAWGLVTEIRSELVPEGAQVVTIQDKPRTPGAKDA